MTTPITGRYRRAKVSVGNDSAYPKVDKKIPEPPKDEKSVTRLTTAPKVEVPGPRPGPVARWVTQQYRTAGKALTPVDPICGQAITLAADNCGMAWERAYKSSNVIKRVIDTLMNSSVAADLFFGNLPIAMAVLAHHSPPFREYVNHSILSFMVPSDLKEEPEKKEDIA